MLKGTQEGDRLSALRSYGILDTAPERGFDDLVHLATQLCRTPVALISLLDDDRQWFKARVGFAPCETSLDQSVCKLILRQPGDLLIIPDLADDERTSGNILVTAAPGIRFYAGAALLSANGFKLGTLCVIDTKPRPQGLSDQEIDNLRVLARQVVYQMDLRRAVTERDAALASSQEAQDALLLSDERYRLSTAATNSVIWDADRDAGFIHWGEGLARVFRHKPEDIKNTRDWWIEQIHPDDRERVLASLREAMTGTFLSWADVYRFRRGDNSYSSVSSHGIVVRDRNDRTVRITGILLDVSEKAEADERQNILNLELSHRLKNVLSMVQAIAAQSLRNATSLTEARDALSDRLVALGRAHDLLLVGSAERAGMDAIIRGSLAVHDEAGAKRLNIEGPPVDVGPRAALALALMMHELGTNAAKYGALSNDDGVIAVKWFIDEGGSEPALELRWIESGGPSVTPPKRLGFGTRMIERALAGTIGSKVKIEYEPTGVSCLFTTPLSSFSAEA